MAREKVEGLRELDAALAELPKATGKNVLRRVLRTAAQPVADDYSESVRRRTGTLAKSAGVSTKLSKRQRSLHRKMFKSDKASVEMFAGAGPLPQAITEEFGTPDQPPQGEMRSSWDANQRGVLDTIKSELWTEIEKAAQRLARKAAKGR
ncbi:HK97 gp10 family phage protein [Neoaquamicrobium sediminum]|uniref:HK97 gp10 family phage protein n=1 Tax=Neoaquamicrobium sediminum TaxID=1849104 RepID=UPI003BA8B2F2